MRQEKFLLSFINSDSYVSRSVRGLDKDSCFTLARVAYASVARDEFRLWHDFCVAKEVNYEAEKEARQRDFDTKMKLLDFMLENVDRFGSMGKSEDGEIREENPLVASLRERLPMDMIVKLTERGNETTRGEKEPTTSQKAAKELMDIYHQLCQVDESNNYRLSSLLIHVRILLSCPGLRAASSLRSSAASSIRATLSATPSLRSSSSSTATTRSWRRCTTSSPTRE